MNRNDEMLTHALQQLVSIGFSSSEDARDDFEKLFPLPAAVTPVGNGEHATYASTEFNNWPGQRFIHKWEGYKACRNQLQPVFQVQHNFPGVWKDVTEEQAKQAHGMGYPVRVLYGVKQ